MRLDGWQAFLLAIRDGESMNKTYRIESRTDKPVIVTVPDPEHRGMTPLEYYAGKALQGFGLDDEGWWDRDNLRGAAIECIVTACFDIAQAMVDEAERRTQ